MQKSEYEKMLSGELFAARDEDIFQMMAQASARMLAYNQLDSSDVPALIPRAAEFLHPESGPTYIKPPFYFEFGKHIKTGVQVFFNFGCTVLDSAPVTIGDFVAIGPNCQFITASHPLRFEERMVDSTPGDPLPKMPMTTAKPITIGTGAWIGAGVTVMPGVTIGEKAVIGAGSVVTRDIPAGVIAVGSPCRVVRELDQITPG